MYAYVKLHVVGTQRKPSSKPNQTYANYTPSATMLRSKEQKKERKTFLNVSNRVVTLENERCVTGKQCKKLTCKTFSSRAENFTPPLFS